MRKTTSLYLITCNVPGAEGVYVGIANDPQKRWNEHRSEARRAKTLYEAMRTYGEAAFTFEVVETYTTRGEAYASEIGWIAHMRCNGSHVYNTADGGAGGSGKHSLEARAKISAARLGKKLSPETCARMSAGQQRRAKETALAATKRSALHYIDVAG